MSKINFVGGITKYIIFNGFVTISFVQEKNQSRIVIEKYGNKQNINCVQEIA